MSERTCLLLRIADEWHLAVSRGGRVLLSVRGDDEALSGWVRREGLAFEPLVQVDGLNPARLVQLSVEEMDLGNQRWLDAARSAWPAGLDEGEMLVEHLALSGALALVRHGAVDEWASRGGIRNVARRLSLAAVVDAVVSESVRAGPSVAFVRGELDRVWVLYWADGRLAEALACPMPSEDVLVPWMDRVVGLWISSRHPVDQAVRRFVWMDGAVPSACAAPEFSQCASLAQMAALLADRDAWAGDVLDIGAERYAPVRRDRRWLSWATGQGLRLGVGVLAMALLPWAGVFGLQLWHSEQRERHFETMRREASAEKALKSYLETSAFLVDKASARTGMARQISAVSAALPEGVTLLAWRSDSLGSVFEGVAVDQVVANKGLQALEALYPGIRLRESQRLGVEAAGKKLGLSVRAPVVYFAWEARR